MERTLWLRRPFAATLMLFAVLLGLVNDAASRADATHTHIVCPEHGEQHHAGVPLAPETERRSPDMRSLTPEEHGPACLIVLLARGGSGPMLPAPSSVDVVFVRIDVPSPTWIDAQVAARRGRLEFAPKTSPPQV